MRAWTLVAVAATLAPACFDGSQPESTARLRLSPLIDTLFVGDTQAPPLRVTYVTAAGDTQAVGRITWSSGNAAVATVDTTGRVVAVGRGAAAITAAAEGALGQALVVVTPTLDVTLLLDTIYLMPGDTFTVPVQVRRKGGAAPAPTFQASAQAPFDIDPVTGLVTANTAATSAVAFVVQADTVADTGAVHVRTLSDTADGHAYFTLFGTVTRRLSAPTRALNYRLRDNTQAFRIRAALTDRGVPVENVIVTLIDPVGAPGAFVIDSLSPSEALGFGADVVCEPPRPWGIWSSALFDPPINALSRRFGTLAITTVDTVPGGLVVGGRFDFRAQRMDYYDDPGGVVPIRGTFVAPLTTEATSCL
jgi:hypothetical protein